MDLSGPWVAAPADDDLRRVYAERDFDDGDWAPIEVPGHWRSSAAFADHDGPLLYRRRFTIDPEPAEFRRWLTFDGVFYTSDVWLDGSYLGDTEGYFAPHTFDVTDLLADGADHVLAVEVSCAAEHDTTAKRNLTGVFQHWDCHDPDWNPGGIWRPVRLSSTGAVRIARLRTVCTEATAERAVLRIEVGLDALAADTVELRTTVGPHDQTVSQPVAAGANTVTWTVTIDRPDLWWPHAMGAQHLYDLAVEARVEGALSDRVTRRVGLRQVTMRNWIVSVNGERLFVKGSNLGPTRMALADATPADLEADVRTAKAAGLDLLRIHAHVTRPELYEAADREGVLIWQDLPLQWLYARSVKAQARAQAEAAVDLLGHHPSIAIWCAHNEPFAVDTEAAGRLSGRDLAKVATRMVLSQELPTWNKSVLDRSLRRALERADPSRPVVKHSGIWPSLPRLDGTDTHVYFGWYHGQERQFPLFCRVIPRMARWVSEFGAQAIPETDAFMGAEAWPDLDWARLGRTHGLQKSRFDVFVPPASFETYGAWKAATQAYQATITRHHIETLRRLKYRPTGGFCQFSLADGHEAVSWAVLDHARVPKAAFDALVEACRPVIVVADRLPASVAPGGAIALDVHVVSDLRAPLTGGTVKATLSWDGGEHRWGWTGDVDADACQRIGTIQAMAPGAPGPLRLTLELTCGPVRATNTYEAVVT